MKKKLIRLSFVLIAVLSLFASCGKIDIEESQIVGTWKAPKYTYRFNSDYSGYRSPNDFPKEYPLTWELDVDELELRISGSPDGQAADVIYETWVITSISSSQFQAYMQGDSSEKTVTFNKI